MEPALKGQVTSWGWEGAGGERHLGGFDDWGGLGCGLWRAFQWREQAGPGLTGKREGF